MKFIAVAASLLGLAAVGSATASEPSTTLVERAAQIDSSAAAIVSVLVGPNKQLIYDPPFISGVGRGQRIHFDFRAANHTFTESSFETPCTKSPTAQFDTNFGNFNPDDIPNIHPFDITLSGSESRFFYCKQGNKTPASHCGKGMVFAINVDAATFAQFQANAAIDGFPKIKGRSAANLKA